jgi:hypothetical protein
MSLSQIQEIEAKKKSIYEPSYKFRHPVLPYEIEAKLPTHVINNIYSYLRPRYEQTAKHNKMYRMQIDLNHKVIRLKELLQERKRRRLLKEQRKKEMISALTKMEEMLMKLL